MSLVLDLSQIPSLCIYMPESESHLYRSLCQHCRTLRIALPAPFFAVTPDPDNLVPSQWRHRAKSYYTAQSHARALELILDTDIFPRIIFEADAIPMPDFRLRIEVPDDADALILGPHDGPRRAPFPIRPYARRVTKVLGAFATCYITRRAAELALQNRIDAYTRAFYPCDEIVAGRWALSYSRFLEGPPAQLESNWYIPPGQPLFTTAEVIRHQYGKRPCPNPNSKGATCSSNCPCTKSCRVSGAASSDCS